MHARPTTKYGLVQRDFVCGVGQMTDLQRKRVGLGYFAALVGSVVGGYLLGGALSALWYSAEPNLGVAVYGQVLLVPVGSIAGSSAALGLFRYRAVLRTVILMLPMTIVAWVVVFGLSRIIDSLGYGWLVIIPPFVAPLSARWLALRGSPPESGRRTDRPARTPKAWPTRRILKSLLLVLAGVALLGIIVFLANLPNSDDEAPDPLGPRICECELLEEWTANLPLTPEDDRVWVHEVIVTERPVGFVIVASRYMPDAFSADSVLDAFSNAGFNHVDLIDRDDRWSASFFPGRTRRDSAWRIDFMALEWDVEVQIGVTVDGSPWGIETIDDLWDFYYKDRDAAQSAQEERQRLAIEMLRPLEDALQSMAGTRDTTPPQPLKVE